MCAGLKAAQAFEGWTIIVAHGKACVDFHVAIHTGPVPTYRNAGEVGPEGLAANPPDHGEVDTSQCDTDAMADTSSSPPPPCQLPIAGP